MATMGRCKQIAVLALLCAGIAGASGCETCTTSTSVTFVGLGGATEHFTHEERTHFFVLPEISAELQCYGRIAEAWGRLTVEEPDLWIPTRMTRCTPGCGSPPLFRGC